ncbi:MAG: glycosyltransferase family 39 protein [Bacteroidetes bacterium]|nr:glycosyltransferase family 39 protein [Bacteroidota bacterium]
MTILQKIKSAKSNLLLIAIWLIFSILFSYHKTVFNPPLSVHQGAQADRASIAYNFFKTNSNFFEPRVMETGTKDGITPSEFPIVSYISALFYKIFGFNDFWYRFVVWCFMSFGFWCAVQIIKIFENSKILSLIIASCWYFGTVLCYYTNNFLPDIASLSLMLYGIYRYQVIQTQNSTLNKVLFTIAITLSCLIKITSLIFVISLLLCQTYFYIKNKKKTTIFTESIIVFIIVFSWYYYCINLEKQVGGSYFLMKIEPSQNLAEFVKNFDIFFSNWFLKIYNIAQWILIGLGLAVLFFTNIKKEIKLFTFISIIGCLAFYALMSNQFRFHDYYIITFMPIMLFLIISAYKFLEKLNKTIAIFIIFSIGFWGMIDAKNGVRLRYSKGNYWYQTFFEPQNFIGTNDWLKKNGIDENKKIFVAFDENPNVMLYMFKRRGYRVFDHNQLYVEEKIKITGNLITSNSSRFFKQYPAMIDKLELASQYKDWKLFKIKNGN